MSKFDINDYMLDGTIEYALRGDPFAKSQLLQKIKQLQLKRKRVPEKILNALKVIKQRKSRPCRSISLSHFIFDKIEELREDGLTWDEVTEAYNKSGLAKANKTHLSRKSLEKIYYDLLPAYQEYRRIQHETWVDMQMLGISQD